ncbi:MAG TPA: hypothetical protein LFW21_00350 [Rickettsia endosymbiont of Pyrocoelia pectoralis]|nr:hypothetical protein [Rickettsia endosymbiont of Pyrocoelia pectoralis]
MVKSPKLAEEILVINKEERKIKDIIDTLNNEDFAQGEVVFHTHDNYIKEIEAKFEEKLEKFNIIQALEDLLEKKPELKDELISYKTEDAGYAGKPAEAFLDDSNIHSNAISALGGFITKHNTEEVEYAGNIFDFSGCNL